MALEFKACIVDYFKLTHQRKDLEVQRFLKPKLRLNDRP